MGFVRSKEEIATIQESLHKPRFVNAEMLTVDFLTHQATVDHLLTTTRSVRKRLDFDKPVEPEVIERCIEIAMQAPTGSNLQGWHFMVVTDPDQRAQIAKLWK